MREYNMSEATARAMADLDSGVELTLQGDGRPPSETRSPGTMPPVNVSEATALLGSGPLTPQEMQRLDPAQFLAYLDILASGDKRPDLGERLRALFGVNEMPSSEG